MLDRHSLAAGFVGAVVQDEPGDKFLDRCEASPVSFHNQPEGLEVFQIIGVIDAIERADDFTETHRRFVRVGGLTRPAKGTSHAGFDRH